MSFNLSELFEIVVDSVPDRVAIVAPTRRLTYLELDERANRLAHHLASRGIGVGDHVGLHLMNGTEYVEGMLAAFKLRAVPVNINYRYVERELEHLYSYMDLAATIAHRRYVPSIEAIAPKLDELRYRMVVDDDSGAAVGPEWEAYEPALAAASPARDFTGRTSDDVYCACTGGTTGLPKGVMWRHEDIFFASLGGGDPLMFQGPISAPDELPSRIPDFPLVMLVTPPLMHVSAHWGAFSTFYGGGKAVLTSPGSFDPVEAWQLVRDEGVNTVVLVGNPMARPFIEHYAEHPIEVPTLFAIGSGGAILSDSTKAQIHELLPNVLIIDGFGSTETGVAGSDSGKADAPGSKGATFKMDANTAVLDENLDPVKPGSDQIGRLARRGRIPLGYYKDERKTAETFVEKDGVRWVIPGDLASVSEDGTIVLHGRGSVSINTGGEKVFPEEVESALIGHPAVEDVIVVGVPDERWGQRVTAVVQLRAGAGLTLEDLQAFGREHLAGYKLPRDLVVVDSITRSPTGKPDYNWARERAVEAAGSS